MTDDIQVGDLVKLNELGAGACIYERGVNAEATVSSVTVGALFKRYYRLTFDDGETLGLFTRDEFEFVSRIAPQTPTITDKVIKALDEYDEANPEETPDMINEPPHYKQYPVEVIEITEHLNFCKGNAVKYVLRAEHKGNEIQDLEKARWYIDREIERLKKGA